MITIDTLRDMLVDLKSKTRKDIHDELMPFLIPIKDMEKELFGAPISTIPFGDGDTYKLFNFLSQNLLMLEGYAQFALIAPGRGFNPETNERKKVFLLFVVESHDVVTVGTWDHESGEYLQEPQLIHPDEVAGDLLLAIKLFAYLLECAKNGIYKPGEFAQATKLVQETMGILVSRNAGD